MNRPALSRHIYDNLKWFEIEADFCLLRLLVNLHKDLTAISATTRSIRSKLAKHYPEASRTASADLACQQDTPDLE